MELTMLAIPEVKLIAPKIFRDGRGFFSETYNRRALDDANISANFVQDNHSLSVERGVIRGLHFQSPPHAQDKLVRVTRGSIFDVAVDIRKGSPTFGKHIAVILNVENWQQLWVPKGFAHGFCTLEPNTEVIYKVTDYFDAKRDKGLAWDDPELGIEWPVKPEEIILSDKDKVQPRLSDLPDYFHYDQSGSMAPV
jgi:dTDP-4-dehydrorhamnose 3,5-epimerase